MERKNKRVLIISLIALILVVAGASYAYFSARITGLESASTLRMTAGTLGIHYSEGDERVLVENIYPRQEKWLSKTITLTGNNNTDLKMNYKLGLNIVTNEFANNELSYSLTLTNTEDPNLKGTPIANKTNEGIQNTTGTQWFGTGQFITGQGQVHEYLLEIFFLDTGDDQNDSQGAVFNASITVEEAGTGDLPVAAPNGWNDAPAGSLLAGIKANNPTPSPRLTVPGMEASASGPINVTVEELCDGESDCEIYYYSTYEDAWKDVNAQSGNYSKEYSNLVGKWIYIEKFGYYVTNATASGLTVTNNSEVTIKESLLLATEDDYGTSYYYRGAVENNYVSFAGMCWRIVRIAGDGSIKLTLYNYASSSCNVDDSTGAYARVDGDTYTSAFNTNYDKNAYVGYMYGTAGSSSYNDEHANTTDSTILSKLKTWYASAFTSAQKELLADTVWCNDKRTVSDTTYNPLRMSGTITGLGYNTEITYYQAVTRLVNSSNSRGGTGPSLKCGNSKTDNKISKFTASTSTDGGYGNGALNGDKIGLLTADEVAFAGGAYYRSNESYYLNANANEYEWWLMTPSYFDGYAYAWRVGTDGNMGYDYNVNDSYAVRPAVSLKSTTTITGGTGSKTSPFTIE